jgi:large subunit ribosomal protein L21
MYAVIATGGKQHRVSPGQRLTIEKLASPVGSEVEIPAVMVVDGDRVAATPAELGSSHVTARVIEDSKGPKIDGFTYKSKANQRRRYGHRQRLSLIEITGVSSPFSSSGPAATSVSSPSQEA